MTLSSDCTTFNQFTASSLTDSKSVNPAIFAVLFDQVDYSLGIFNLSISQ